MRTTTKMELRPIDQLVPYAKNARTHSEKQIEALRASLREFGFVSPILIDCAGNVIAGHGRLLAAKQEGMTEVPCVLVEHLTDAQRRAYILADNRLAENAGWDRALVVSEISALQAEGFDAQITGFDPAGLNLDTQTSDHFWGEIEAESTPEYDDLIERSTHKLTTDDYYTPKIVYDAVKNFVVDYYGLKNCRIIRPFSPGGNYQAEDYSGDCVVIDNPPFSIITEVIKYFLAKSVQFFLFAPALSIFAAGAGECNYLPVGTTIMYENGVRIATSFVTSLGDLKIDTCPELYQIIEAATKAYKIREKGILAENYYPDNVINYKIQSLSRHGVHYRVRADDCYFIRALDAQKPLGKGVYGAGFLLSEKSASEKKEAEQAAEKIAAEKMVAEKWELSEREIKIIKSLGGGEGG